MLKTVDGLVLTPRQCYNCGKEFGGAGDEAWCTPCEMEIRARERPEFLKDLEHVRAGHPPQNDFQRAMHVLLHKRPQDFVAKLVAAQKDYDAKMVALAQAEVVKASSPGEIPAQVKDEGSERVEELIERLLKEAGEIPTQVKPG